MARKVTQQERDLWDKVAATTNRGLLPPVLAPAPIKKDVAVKPVKKPSFTPTPFKIGSMAKASKPVAQNAPAKPLAIDAKAMTRMRRGKTAPEARIDLHGMTQSEAMPALTEFILHAAQRNLRMVLVITGKGRKRPDEGPIPERFGVLRQNVPGWLTRAPLGTFVQGVVQSHQKHGGGGAYYVYLRRTGA